MRSRESRIQALIENAVKLTQEAIGATTGVNIKVDTALKMNPSNLLKVAQKMPVNITEVDDENDLTMEQNEAIFNIKTWATELGLELSNQIEGSGTIQFNYKINEDDINNIIINIFPNGSIKISGHDIQSFDDFQNITEFLEDEYSQQSTEV